MTICKHWFQTTLIIFCSALAGCMESGEKKLDVTMYKVTQEGTAPKIGKILISSTRGKKGIKLTPDLHGLPRSMHDFHVYTASSCEPAEKAGHSNTTMIVDMESNHNKNKTGIHEGLECNIHPGYLATLKVDTRKNAIKPVFIPGLTLQKMKGLALVIHAGGDSFTAPSLSGDTRLACGVIP
ncbi:superoxide dismutase family protein [Endozoicomonas atrinae]|uniref:superoxide dismutase family protein n=1 Tax=Endozoicomonas atrinae TaxID=1333660 RepID=UPI003B003971